MKLLLGPQNGRSKSALLTMVLGATKRAMLAIAFMGTQIADGQTWDISITGIKPGMSMAQAEAQIRGYAITKIPRSGDSPFEVETGKQRTSR